MATLTTLKKKIAALEAQVERVTKAELGNAIAKIRKIMGDYGVTLEHLSVTAKNVKAKAARKSSGATKTKGQTPAKYQDPKSGATWSGRGRIPAWIAGAEDRSAFLIGSAGSGRKAESKAKPKASTKAKKPAAKPAAAPRRPSETAGAKKTASRKKVASPKGSASAKRPTKSSSGANKPAVRKGRRAPKKVTAPGGAPAGAPASDTAAS